MQERIFWSQEMTSELQERVKSYPRYHVKWDQIAEAISLHSGRDVNYQQCRVKYYNFGESIDKSMSADEREQKKRQIARIYFSNPSQGMANAIGKFNPKYGKAKVGKLMNYYVMVVLVSNVRDCLMSDPNEVNCMKERMCDIERRRAKEVYRVLSLQFLKEYQLHEVDLVGFLQLIFDRIDWFNENKEQIKGADVDWEMSAPHYSPLRDTYYRLKQIADDSRHELRRKKKDEMS